MPGRTMILADLTGQLPPPLLAMHPTVYGIGLLAVAIALFVTGFLLQLRATTLTGGTLLVCEVVMLLVSAFLRVKDQVAIAIFHPSVGPPTTQCHHRCPRTSPHSATSH